MKHIKLESMFLRYALITLHAGTYDVNTLREMRLEFKKDCEEFKIINSSEGVPMQESYTAWGI